MLDYVRPTITYGNDFHMLITMEQFIDGELFEFDLTKCKQVRVYLTCAIHNTEIQLPFEIVEPNVIDAFVDYRLLHCTSYGICVEGFDENDQHWRWFVLPKEGILIIPNTSGQKIPQEVRYIDIHGRVGFGVDLSDYVKYEYLGDHYYSKEETNALLEGKQDVLVDSGDDQNIKTINGQSILGAGNITIEQATQQQANWTEQDTSAVSYIQNKPDLSIYATTSSLSTVATSGDYDDLQNKPTIPDAPVQSDWNETGTSSLAYILNKPDMSNYATTSALADKQDVLVSGSNIKTINNESILGSGNIAIQAGSSVDDYVIDYSKRYFTIKSLADNNTITWKATDASIVKTISVSTDDGATWTQYTSATSGTTIATLNKNEYIFVKGSNSSYGSSLHSNNFLFSNDGDVEGNIMSLVYSDNFIGQTTLNDTYTFRNLFAENQKLINAKNLVLPATTLTERCYYQMFLRCTSLVVAQSILPATTLTNSCYYYMFAGCTSLTKAPELPATTLVFACYRDMFDGCTSLTKAPELPATTLDNYCYSSMFSGCTSIVSVPSILPATKLKYACYWSMFSGCTSLTKAPELPATTLDTYNCYASMFNGCTQLNFVKCLAENISQQSYITNWMNNVSSTGTFITANTPPTWSRDASGIPSGWNVYTEAEWEYVHNYQLANYATTSALANKQDALISGSNIKTINNESILGSGNIAIQAGSSGMEPFDSIWDTVHTTGDFITSAQNASLGHVYTGQVEFTDAPFTTPAEAQVTITDDAGMYGLTIVIDVFENSTHWQYISYAANPGTWNSVAYSSSIPAAPVQSDWNETGTSSLAYILNKPDLSNYATTSSLSTVATSGDYADLLNKPTIPDAPVQSDWNETGTSSLAYILNKPDLSNYATTSALANKQDTLVSGVNIKTINSESILGSGNIAISGGEHDYSKDYLTIEATANYCEITFNCGRYADRRTIEISTDNGTTWTSKTSSTAGVTLASLSNGDKLLLRGSNTSYGTDGIYANHIIASKSCIIYGNILSLVYRDNFENKTLQTTSTFNELFFSSKVTSAENLILPNNTYGDCYNAMFMACNNLINAPKLPATTAKYNCYKNMFYGCTSLTTAPELPATTLEYSCYQGMFNNCTSLVKAPELPATTLVSGCYNSMFKGCTSLVQAPELPATTLTVSCYNQMFDGCTSLTYIKCLATDISANNCTNNWVNNVAASGTFVMANNMSSWTSGVSGIPSGWNAYTQYGYTQIPEQSDWNETITSSMAYILNKPTIPVLPNNIVTGSTSGIVISITSALPASPSADTIYVIP